MRLTINALCLVALMWPGAASALELQVAIARSKQQTVTRAPAKSSRETLLADFNLAVARETCRRLKARCVFSYESFPEIIPGIASRRFQLGFGTFLRTPEREARVAFSDALFQSSSRLLAFSQVAARFASSSGSEVDLDSLRDARVVTISGSQQQLYLQNQSRARGLAILGRVTMGDCLDALYEGEADFALLPVLGAYLALDPTVSNTPVFIGPGVIDHGLGGSVHIALPREDEELRQGVNTALHGMRHDGSYQRIWRQHFPFDLY